MKNFDFVLSRTNQDIGQITWLCGGDNGNGLIKGDALAVSELNRAISLGIGESWRGRYPLPRRVIVRDPLNYVYEMVTVLEQAGFDMPDVLYPYTAKAQREQREKNMDSLPPNTTKCY